MKRIVFLAAWAALFALSSLAASGVPAPLPLATSAHLNTSKMPPEIFRYYNVSEVTFIGYNACVGEELEFTITMYERVLILENGQRSNSPLTVRWKGTAVGLTTGTEYIINEHHSDVYNVSKINSQLLLIGEHKYNLISRGGGNNFSIRFSFAWKINANGELIEESFDNFIATCK